MKRKLAALVIASAIGVSLSAGGIYYFERAAQPEAFGSIFSSMWWAIVTLATIGYQDVYPHTAGGKIFAALVSLIGFGLIIGMVGIALDAYFRRTLESMK